MADVEVAVGFGRESRYDFLLGSGGSEFVDNVANKIGRGFVVSHEEVCVSRLP